MFSFIHIQYFSETPSVIGSDSDSLADTTMPLVDHVINERSLVDYLTNITSQVTSFPSLPVSAHMLPSCAAAGDWAAVTTQFKLKLTTPRHPEPPSLKCQRKQQIAERRGENQTC